MNKKLTTNQNGYLTNLTNVWIPKDIKRNFWQDLDIAIFDVETTGLEFDNPKEFRITQFAAGLYTKAGKENFKKKDEINIRINPEIETPKEVIEITGIYNSDLDKPGTIEKHGKFDTKNCPTFREAKGQIKKFMYEKADLWSAFNHKFDINAYASELIRNDEKKLISEKPSERNFHYQPCVDPLVFQRYFVDRRGMNTLWDLATSYGVAKTGDIMEGDEAAHEAQTDVIMLASVLEKMAPKMPATVENLFDKQETLFKRQIKEYGT